MRTHEQPPTRTPWEEHRGPQLSTAPSARGTDRPVLREGPRAQTLRRVLRMALSLVAAGCGGAPVEVPTTPDAARDDPPPDATTHRLDASSPSDRPSLGHDAVEVVNRDIPAAPDRCTNDDVCADPAMPVCDRMSGQCVACTPSDDRCPTGRYCVAGMNRCADGCRDDLDCGGGTPRCDLARHACVACLTAGHCSLAAVCVDGQCLSSCGGPTPCLSPSTCCGQTCADLQTSLAHCGACAQRCAPANAMPTCDAGACRIERCVAPFADCDGEVRNGCETNTLTDVTHCGACGSSCAASANRSVTCEAGACRATCLAGFADCNGDPADGCEVDLRASADHCGACGRRCALPNATAACALGGCTVTGCAAGYGDCNRNASDGCEVDVRASPTHCGGCGRMCALANAVPVCSVGACVVGACSGLQGDCDGVPANGCETPLGNLSHCGACGRVCPTPSAPHTVANCATTGTRAICSAVCEPGWLDCDANLENGCEAQGACTRTRQLFADGFMSGAGSWSLPNNGRAAFGITFSGNCRNPTYCFGCDVCLGVSGYCGSSATATLSSTYDFSRVTSGAFSFYSIGSPGPSDRFILQASTDGGLAWRDLSTPLPSACCINTASPQIVDLRALAGARSVQFRFLFENNCDPTDTFGIGWTLDDVTLTVVERTY